MLFASCSEIRMPGESAYLASARELSYSERSLLLQFTRSGLSHSFAGDAVMLGCGPVLDKRQGYAGVESLRWSQRPEHPDVMSIEIAPPIQLESYRKIHEWQGSRHHLKKSRTQHTRHFPELDQVSAIPVCVLYILVIDEKFPVSVLCSGAGEFSLRSSIRCPTAKQISKAANHARHETLGYGVWVPVSAR
jgi:hypothetical protein